MNTFLAGLSLALSLIVVIGAQNAFVLKQGLKKQRVFLVCSIFAFSDAALIIAAILGFGHIIQLFPNIETVARYGGALFLSLYALFNFISAFKNTHSMQPEGQVPTSVWTTITMCLAFTWLNPHVYLDITLIAAVSTQYQNELWQFTLGSVSGSFLFLFALGYGARWLLPLFQKPISWKILEFIIGVVMLSIAISLLSF